MPNGLVVGDVLEIRLTGGVAYAAFAGKNGSLGDAIWVVPIVFPSPTKDWKAVFERDGFFVFYAANAAVRRKLVQKVGFSTDAMRPLPAKRRSAVDVDDDGAVTKWLITQGSERIVRRASEVDEHERNLPIATIWNHESLKDAILSGRRPT